MKIYELRVRKDHLKFSAAHMTVFAHNEKERLHGHNYYVEIAVEYSVPDEGHLLPVALLKDAAREICEPWNEKVLLAEKCPYLQIQPSSEASVRFTLCGKTYELPEEDIAWLPRMNITIETLAEEFLERLSARLAERMGASAARLHWVEVAVEETVGQQARNKKFLRHET